MDNYSDINVLIIIPMLHFKRLFVYTHLEIVYLKFKHSPLHEGNV